jgi:hypothetical protein
MIYIKLHNFSTFGSSARENHLRLAEYCDIVNEEVHIYGQFYSYFTDIIYKNVVSVDDLVLSTKASITYFPDLKLAETIQFSSGFSTLGKLEYVNNMLVNNLDPEIEIFNKQGNIYEFYKNKILFHTMKIDNLTILDEPNF